MKLIIMQIPSSSYVTSAVLGPNMLFAALVILNRRPIIINVVPTDKKAKTQGASQRPPPAQSALIIHSRDPPTSPPSTL
jgi:hypothetical protein